MAVIFLELSICSVRGGKSGSCWEPSSRMELHVKFLAKRSYGRPVKNAVAPEVTRSDKLRCNKATSCFSTVLYFQESHSNGTNGNNDCDVQW